MVHEERGKQAWSRPRAMGARDGDGELDVAADVGVEVIDYADHQQAAVPQAEGMDFVSGNELARLVGVDSEGREQGGGVAAVDGQLEGNAVHEGPASGLLIESCGLCHVASEKQGPRERGTEGPRDEAVLRIPVFIFFVPLSSWCLVPGFYARSSSAMIRGNTSVAAFFPMKISRCP